VIVRTVEYLNELVELGPFAEVGPGDGHNYVTFLSHRPDAVPDLPFRSSDDHFLALGFHDREFFAVTYKRPDGRYGDFGAFMRREFGKQPVTTRNWKTVLKLAAM
jgi:hypothetical protein